MAFVLVPTKTPDKPSALETSPSIVTQPSGADAILEMRRTTSCMLVLDHTLRILSADAQAEELLIELETNGCLPTELHRDLAQWVDAGMPTSIATFAITQGLLARALVLGGESPAIGLLLERTRSRESLEDAAQRYRLSARESEVSRHIINGDSSCEISSELNISEHTVADYLKRIFSKTGARSRSELVAMLLGWRSSAQPTCFQRIVQ